MEDIRWLASLGVGGILAGLVLWFYHQDRLAAQAFLEEHIQALRDLVSRLEKAQDERLTLYREESKETREVLRELAKDLRLRNGG